MDDGCQLMGISLFCPGEPKRDNFLKGFLQFFQMNLTKNQVHLPLYIFEPLHSLFEMTKSL